MSDGARLRALLLWIVFVAFCTFGMAYLPFEYQTLPGTGHVTYYEVILVVTGLLAVQPLIRTATGPERGAQRTMCRILLVYLLFELLVVIPIAISLGTATVNTILGAAVIRFTWLLFPVVLTLCADDRTRKMAGAVVVVAAACLALWGVYSAATGGAGYYLDSGELRYRVLIGGATLLFAWPFALAASRAVPRRYTLLLLGVSLVGLTLTNHRSGLIAFAITGVVCVAMSGQFRRLVPWIVPATLVAIVVGLVWGTQLRSIFGYTLSRLLDFSSGNGADRLARWRLAWDYFASRPINDFVWSWRYTLTSSNPALVAHDFALEIAVAEGVAGLVFYGSVLAVALRHAWKWAREDAEARALFGYLIAYLVFVLANANWYQPVNMALFVAGVAALVARVDRLSGAETSGVPIGGAEHDLPAAGTGPADAARQDIGPEEDDPS
jgi:hypothetical protein